MNKITQSLLSAVLLTGIVSTTAVAADENIEANQKIYRDAQFQRLSQHLTTEFTQKGYKVVNVEVDDDGTHPSLELFAEKNNHAYELTFSYPDLDLIESTQRIWTQQWHNDHIPDREDRIKKAIYEDANYDRLRAQAISKLENMGYKVVKVEADDYRLQGILDIEATKNAREYEIKLSYPSLDILVIEEDD